MAGLFSLPLALNLAVQSSLKEGKLKLEAFTDLVELLEKFNMPDEALLVTMSVDSILVEQERLEQERHQRTIVDLIETLKLQKQRFQKQSMESRAVDLEKRIGSLVKRLDSR